ncbi:MAG: replicative DNA helicase [Bdellovibrionales bacterium RBG_16_40_8]|nr:MAG: replicative DNA helicase [Bdellovibrionales bacterium RBG_16_40_8]
MDGRIPPQNIQAEQSVLGGLMLEQDAWDQVADLINDGDFYKPAHRIIYSSIRELNRRGQPTDLITVSNYLMQTGQLDSVGGPTYLTEMMDLTPSTVNIRSYAQIVREKNILRKIISTGSSFVDKAYSQDFSDLDSFLNEVESSIFHVAETNTNQDLVDASQLVKMSLEHLEKLYANKGDVTGLSSGFFDLDKITAGFQPGELIIIAARPSMGKTAFSLNIALSAAMREKKTVAYFSVEMGKEQVMMRLLASEARISLTQLRSGNIDETAWPKLINTAAKLSESSLYIDDTSGISPFDIRAKARRLKARHGLDMLIVDYLQLMSLKQKVESREREVSEISKMLKGLARELKIPVLALSQLNRGVEGRSDRRPLLSDLRESGSIEQDADVIMMLFREDYYDRDTPEVKGLAEVIIGKQRNGPTGTVKLRWRPEYGLFDNNIDSQMAPPPQQQPFRSSASITPLPPNHRPKNFAPQF